MKKGENFNHPKSGVQIKVEPIKLAKDIRAIKKILADKPRNLALFTVRINTNLRTIDLLSIKAGQVRFLKPMDELEVKEKKIGKIRRVTLNKVCVDAIRRLLSSQDYADSDPLFKGRGNEPLTVPSVNRLVKQWADAINLRGNYESHTQRKAFGYHRGSPSVSAYPN